MYAMDIPPPVHDMNYATTLDISQQLTSSSGNTSQKIIASSFPYSDRESKENPDISGTDLNDKIEA